MNLQRAVFCVLVCPLRCAGVSAALALRQVKKADSSGLIFNEASQSRPRLPGRCWRTNRGRFVLSSLGVAFAVGHHVLWKWDFFNGINDSQANLALVLDADLILESKAQKNHLKETETHYHQTAPPRRYLWMKSFRSHRSTPRAPTGGNPQNGQSELCARYRCVLGRPQPYLFLKIERYKKPVAASGYRSLYDQWARKRFRSDFKSAPEHKLDDTLVTVVGTLCLGIEFLLWRAHHRPAMKNYYRMFCQLGGRKRVVDEISLGVLRLKSRCGSPVAVKRCVIPTNYPMIFTVRNPDGNRATRENYIRIKKKSLWHHLWHWPDCRILWLVWSSVTRFCSNEIQDHLAQLATLKANWAPSGVCPLALWLARQYSCLCWALYRGLSSVGGLYRIIEAYTLIIMFLTPARIVLIFILTTSMCLISVTLAVF